MLIVPSTMLEPLFSAIVRNGSVAETEFVITCAGFHPSFVAMTYDWIVGVGVAKMTKVSAPDAFSFATCTAGGVVALRSYGWALTIIDWCASPRPAFRPRR